MGSKNSEAPVAATNEASNSPVISETTDMKSLAKAYANFTIFKFGDSEIRVIDKNGDPWFVAKDVCSVLSIANSRDGIARLDEDEKDVALTDTLGGVQEMAIVSESGMYTLVLRCRDAIKPGTVPHTFRKWVTAEVLPAIRKSGQYSKNSKKTSVDERTPLRDAVNMLVSKKHLMYPEAYSMVHQRFNIESIEDLTPDQIPLAVEYIHRVVLEGELLAKQPELPAMSRQFTDEEICSLAWLWLVADNMRQHAEKTYPALRALESKYAGEAHDIAKEFNYWLRKVMDVLVRESSHIMPESTKAPCLDALIHVRNHKWNSAILPRS